MFKVVIQHLGGSGNDRCGFGFIKVKFFKAKMQRRSDASVTGDGTRLVPSRVTSKEESNTPSHAHGLGTRPGLKPCVWANGACDHPAANTA